MNTFGPERRRRAARERKRAENASIGWREILDEDEVVALFDRLVADFFACDDLSVPAPFKTWDVTRAISLPQGSPEQRSMIDDLHKKCLLALKRCNLGSEPWYVLENYNHPCYRWQFSEMPDHTVEWPVELLPYGDPCYLLAHDFSSGIIAKVHSSITVFGEQLLTAINANLPLIFDDKQLPNLANEGE